jgi:hypothetical protein
MDNLFLHFLNSLFIENIFRLNFVTTVGGWKLGTCAFRFSPLSSVEPETTFDWSAC